MRRRASPGARQVGAQSAPGTNREERANAKDDAAPLPAWLEGSPGAWRIRVAAQPGAPRSEIVGEHDRCLKIRVAAPPVEGRANDEILRFLAERLDVPRRALRLVSGAGARRKSCALDAPLSAQEIEARLYQGWRP